LPARPLDTRAPQVLARAVHSDGEAPLSGRPVGRDFFERDVLAVARELIGCVLRVGDVAGRIVETEAYHEREPACHGHRGVTDRCRSLFGPPGTAYVYRSYGVHWCFNIVCERPGVGAAVLVRAVEPLAGIEAMRARRGVKKLTELCSGPGKLCRAFAIGGEHDGVPLGEGAIAVFAPTPDLPALGEVVATTRIGISRATDLEWRFCVAGSPFVSRPRPRSVGVREAQAARAASDRRARSERSLSGR